MMWLAGTSGYSYKQWKGPFYPEDIKNDEMLSFYASKLPAVEINNTFYRMPRTSVLENWSASVPAHFRFVIKASRRITHHARLQGAEESINYLATRVAVLEDKLGAVLFQLPPFLRKDIDRLKAFLVVWPKALPAAIEFRNESWFDEETFDLLRAHAIAIVVSEDGDLPSPAEIATTDWLYLRLREPGYSSQKLAGWVRKARASGARKTLAFFKHEDDGAGPELANRFLRLAEAPQPARAPRRVPKRKAQSKHSRSA
ncbi:MAG: DUF72 domain-containing protein [Gammaproteobacteria bacterium]|nr:DUF72 domain-containing protein [Gammaproteobacteria bacterium]